MAKKSRDYWKSRMEALEEEQYRRSIAYYQDVKKQFARAESAMQADIERWYWRLAENNGVSYAAAKKLLSKKEMEEFRWTVEQYIKAGEENGLDGKWIKQLENASARYHIDRLSAMKLQLRQHVEILFKEYRDGVTGFLQESFAEQYYKTAWEAAKGCGTNFNLARIDTRKMDTLLKRPWAQDGKHFSDRIWGNKEKLVGTLHTELSQCIIRGDAPRDAINRLSKKMNVSKSQAGNLIMTESAAIASIAERDCFREMGTERYQVDATLDGITCEVCQGMDGAVFSVSDFEIGVTAPPIHPRCRCCMVAFYDDWEEFGITVERAARDPATDKTVFVDGNLKYAEWKRKFVNNTEEVAQIAVPGIMDAGKTKEAAGVHTIGKINREIYKCITDDIVTDEVIITDERIGHIEARHPGDYEKYKKFMLDMILDPDYIVRDDRPFTAMVLKEFDSIDGSKHFRLALRLKTSQDNRDFNNSVITFMKIREKEYIRLVKNKQVLYKKE